MSLFTNNLVWLTPNGLRHARCQKLFQSSLESDFSSKDGLESDTIDAWLRRLRAAIQRDNLPSLQRKKVFCLFPNQLLFSITIERPDVDNEELTSLVALSHISEMSYIAPDKICYGYCVQSDDEQKLIVFACQLEVWTALQYSFKHANFKGLVPLSAITKDFNKQWHKSLNIPVLKPYNPHHWQQLKQTRRWKYCLQGTLFIQMLALILYFSLQSWVQDEQSKFALLTAKIQPLTPVAEYIPFYRDGLMALQPFPKRLRLNSLAFDDQGILIDLHGQKEDVTTFVNRLRSLPDYHVGIEWDGDASLTQFNQRSMQHAMVTIQKP